LQLWHKENKPLYKRLYSKVAQDRGRQPPGREPAPFRAEFVDGSCRTDRPNCSKEIAIVFDKLAVFASLWKSHSWPKAGIGNVLLTVDLKGFKSFKVPTFMQVKVNRPSV